jgi:hypothetical protein
MASLCSRPITHVLLKSNLPCNKAMAPPARKDRALLSEDFYSCSVNVDSHRIAQHFSDILGINEGTTVSSIALCQWCCQRCLVASVEQNMAHSGLDRAAPGISAQSLNQFFVPISLLLRCESVRCRCCSFHFSLGRGEEVQVDLGCPAS